MDLKSIKKEVNDFLSKYNMNEEQINIENEIKIFLKEMDDGLQNKISSLKMIPTYISVGQGIPTQEPVIVMDAGGTNLRIAVVEFDEHSVPNVSYFKKYNMPGLEEEITKQEFFKKLVDYLKPVLNKSNKIGFCFSYPTEILPNRDGKIIELNKEVKVSGMASVNIWVELKAELRRKGYTTEYEFTLLNDTVATLLGGKASFPERQFDSFIGFILGTGTNTCYLEKNINILKNENLKHQIGSSIINVESGGYAKMVRGELDCQFDKMTTNPGEQLFEKMISGAYQGPLIEMILRKSSTDGLLSQEIGEAFVNSLNLIAKDVTDFCEYPYSIYNPLGSILTVSGTQEDRLKIYLIIENILERAAKLVAINLFSIMEKVNIGTNPCLPVCISAEGSTFYKSSVLREKLDQQMYNYRADKLKGFCEFIKTENATLIGTAIAGLSN